jgi:serine/threonine protein kinase
MGAAMEPGLQLGHYRLVEKIGEGGMGVVWKAVDTTLDRIVAIKLLPETFAADAERVARFEREAKSLAALNDPHIAGIYGLHEAEGRRFIAMEYVDGEDLAQRLVRGPLAIVDAVEIARTVADALSTAHANGVVHRDLKPANVKLTADGAPKVLDFGLAKAVAPEGTLSGSDPSAAGLSPTMTSLGTVAGVILGTAAYMSPEQARGRAVDRRADVWALGAMLYEMLTGRAPFDGETVSDTLASVLKSEPDWNALPADTPPAVRRLLRRCLEKNPRLRLHDAADARIELTHAFDDPEPAAEISTAPRVSRGALLLMTVVAVIGGGLLGFTLRGGGDTSATDAPRIVSALEAPEGVTLNVRQLPLAVSPSGDQLVFVGVDDEGRSHLYVRRLDARDARRIDGTEGAQTPFWSPDGSEIAFHSGTRLLRVPVEGGTPQVIAEVSGRDGTWNRNGTILLGAINNGPLLRIDASGEGFAALDGTSFGPGSGALAPQFLPDGRHYIFQVDDLGGDNNGVYLGELGSVDVTRLVHTQWNASYGDGRLLYVKDDMLVAQPLDLASRRLTGEPRRVAGPVLRLNYPFHGFFSTASGGNRLAYLHGSQAAGLAELVWVDRAGDELERTGIRGDLYNARLSKDGRRVVLDVSTSETHGDIWIYDLARGSSRRLTRDPIDESRPSWTPDESSIVFFRIPDLYTIDVAEGSEARVIYSDPREKILTDLSPDGRSAMFFEIDDDNDRNLRVLDLASGEARDWLNTEYSEMDGRFSPDGQWVAYVSMETGVQEIYVDRFPERGERFRISTEGGSWPIWRRDGKELFYFSTTNDVMAVPMAMDSATSPIGTPKKLFSPRLRRDYFDVSPDGQRFLLIERIDPQVSSITLVQGWADAGD